MEVDVTLKEVEIPVQETTYWCHIQKLDDFIQQKHHIVQFEPLISNEDIVHHMEVFHWYVFFLFSFLLRLALQYFFSR